MACIAVILTATTKSQNAVWPGPFYYDKLCLWDNDDDKWCFKFEEPSVKIGWEWTQTWSEAKTSYPLNYY